MLKKSFQNRLWHADLDLILSLVSVLQQSALPLGSICDVNAEILAIDQCQVRSLRGVDGVNIYIKLVHQRINLWESWKDRLE